MFRINRKTDYAVRVMVCLARRPAGTRLATQIVQNEMLVPHAFLQRIVADLSRAELIYTFAGPNGGLQLARPPHEISLRQIWEALEGPMLISDCLNSCGDCPLENDCPVRPHWQGLQAMIVRDLDSTNLDALAG